MAAMTFLDRIVSKARTLGYVQTLFGREVAVHGGSAGDGVCAERVTEDHPVASISGFFGTKREQSGAARRAKNAVCQASASDLVHAAIVQVSCCPRLWFVRAAPMCAGTGARKRGT